MQKITNLNNQMILQILVTTNQRRIKIRLLYGYNYFFYDSVKKLDVIII
jgi:hypothetical protein